MLHVFRRRQLVIFDIVFHFDWDDFAFSIFGNTVKVVAGTKFKMNNASGFFKQRGERLFVSTVFVYISKLLRFRIVTMVRFF